MTCILVAPSDFHRISVLRGGGARFIKLGIGTDLVGEQNERCRSLVLQGISAGDFLVNLFRELLQSAENARYFSYLANAAICTLGERGESILPIEGTAGYRIAAAATKILLEEFSGTVTERDVARKLSVSPQYLSRVFAENVGVGFSSYLSDLRLSHAARLLEEGGESVTAVCFECGYGSLSHFLRAFRKKYGVSAGEYRHGARKM